MTRKSLIVVVAAAAGLLVVIAALVRIGPRNVIGMIRYDQREEGTLKVGDAAPSVELYSLDGVGREALSAHFGEKPTVLIFGSFT